MNDACNLEMPDRPFKQISLFPLMLYSHYYHELKPF